MTRPTDATAGEETELAHSVTPVDQLNCLLVRLAGARYPLSELSIRPGSLGSSSFPDASS